MGSLIWIASLASSTTSTQHFYYQIIVDFGLSIAMMVLTPFTILLFVLTTNVLPYQSNNGVGRFDQDVDGIDSLLDQNELINERQGMVAPIGGGISEVLGGSNDGSAGGVVAGGPFGGGHGGAIGGMGGAVGGLAGGYWG